MTAPTTSVQPPAIRRSPKGLGRLRRPTTFTVLSLVVALFITALIVYPLGSTFITVLIPNGHLQTSAFSDVFGSPVFWQSVRNSAVIVLVSGTLAIVIGSLIAWLNERTDAVIPFLSRILPIVPLLMPGIAVSIGWVFLGDSRVGYLNVLLRDIASAVGIKPGVTGPIDIATFGGMIFVYTIFLIPLPYLVVSAALRNVDPALEEASRMSGASLGRTLWRVTLPNVRVALMSAVLLVVVDGFSIYSVPVIIGTRAQINVLSVYTVSLVNQSFPPKIDDAVTISFFLAIVLGAIWYLNRRVQRSARFSTISGRSSSAIIRLRGFRPVARGLMVVYILLTSVLPLLAVLLVSIVPFWSTQINPSQFSLQNFVSVFSSPYLAAAFRNSLGLAAIGSTVAILIGAVLAAYIRTLRAGALGAGIDAVMKLPAATTHIVTGIAFLVALGAAPFHLYGTTLILLLAYIAIYMPSASTSAMSANAQVGSDTFEASLMSGSSATRTFRKITLPLMRPGLAAGWALVFVAIVGDMTASSMLAGGPNPVVGFALLDLWNSGTFAQLSALAAMITIISLAFVGVILALGRNRARGR